MENNNDNTANGDGNEAGGEELPAPTTVSADAIALHADSIEAEEMEVTAASEIRSAVVRQPTRNEKKKENKMAKEDRKRKREEEENEVMKRRRTDEVEESTKLVQTEMTPETTMRKEERRSGLRRSGTKPWLEAGEEAWKDAGEKYGVERIASKDLTSRKRAEVRRRVEGTFMKRRWSQFERRARATAKRKGKALGSAAIQQLRETHPTRERTRPDQPTINLRESLSQRNESHNIDNSARFFRKEDQRPNPTERPLMSSTPAPRQRTPEMTISTAPKRKGRAPIDHQKEGSPISRRKSRRGTKMSESLGKRRTMRGSREGRRMMRGCRR